jgi:hypothetical protein
MQKIAIKKNKDALIIGVKIEVLVLYREYVTPINGSK